jgi:hypothetical protein
VRRFNDVDDIIMYVNNSGSPFFSPNTMRSFQSRVAPGVYGPNGEFFITSEKARYGEPAVRRYTIRYIGQFEDGSLNIGHLGALGAYSTLKRARSSLTWQLDNIDKMRLYCPLQREYPDYKVFCNDCGDQYAVYDNRMLADLNNTFGTFYCSLCANRRMRAIEHLIAVGWIG